MRRVLIFALILIVAGLLMRERIFVFFFSPTESVLEEVGLGGEIEIVTENLEIPWEMVPLPSGEWLVTERPGRLLKIGKDKTVIPVEGVEHRGEGGLLGLALHPDFERNGWIYLYLTSKSGEKLINRVERYRLASDELFDKKIILDNIPGASNHDGGRIAFGPDELLYITTGDAGDEASAQDTRSLAGKILRLHDDGRVPADNPFGNAVYSYGHRNSQGLAWDEAGNLWATEHGRSGLQSGYDELNLITKGANYGWPEIEGDETREGMITPVANSGADETWAPGGAVYTNGSIFFAGLRGETLYEAKLEGTKVADLVAHLRGNYGRLRSVSVVQNSLYVLTSNRDGRGTPKLGDDKIIRLLFHDN